MGMTFSLETLSVLLAAESQHRQNLLRLKKLAASFPSQSNFGEWSSAVVVSREKSKRLLHHAIVSLKTVVRLERSR